VICGLVVFAFANMGGTDALCKSPWDVQRSGQVGKIPRFGGYPSCGDDILQKLDKEDGEYVEKRKTIERKLYELAAAIMRDQKTSAAMSTGALVMREGR
jgi:hypothetical protein